MTYNQILTQCENESRTGETCYDLFNCCSCGGAEDCGCPYCFDCNACDFCLNEE